MDEYLGKFAVRMLENETALHNGTIKISVPLSLLCVLQDCPRSAAFYGDDDIRLHSKLQAIRSILAKCRKVKLIHGRNLLPSVHVTHFLPLIIYLELNHIDIQQLHGLAEIRDRLQILVVVDSYCRTLATLLGECGEYVSGKSVDTVSLGKSITVSRNNWTQLKAFFFVGCGLQKLDDSLGLCSVLDALNLRRNELTTCGEYLLPLSNLTSLDVSYNRLIRFPSLAASARLSIRTLVLRHNFLDDESVMPALAALNNLRYLDLAWNFVAKITTLRCLKRFRFLRVLFLEGNPLCATKLATVDTGAVYDYRVVVAAHTYTPNVSLLKVDGRFLDREETTEARSLILTDADETEAYFYDVADADNDTLNEFDDDSDVDAVSVNANNVLTTLCSSTLYDLNHLDSPLLRFGPHADFDSSEQHPVSASGSNEITKSTRSFEDAAPTNHALFHARAQIPSASPKRGSVPDLGVVMAPSRRAPVSLVAGSVPRATIVDRFEGNEDTLEETLKRELTRAQSGSQGRTKRAGATEDAVNSSAGFPSVSKAEKPAQPRLDIQENGNADKNNGLPISAPIGGTTEQKSLSQTKSELIQTPLPLQQHSISSLNGNNPGDKNGGGIVKLKPDSYESTPFHVVVLEPANLASFNSVLAQELSTTSRGSTSGVDKNQLELFVSVGNRHLTERTLNGCVVELLELDALSDVRQDADNDRCVLIKLSYQRRDRQIRHYLVESEDSAFELVCLLEPWLLANNKNGASRSSVVNETGILSTSLTNNQLAGGADGDMAPVMQKCMRCSLSFSRDRAKRNYERVSHLTNLSSGSSANVREILTCPRCESSLLTEVRLPSDSDAALSKRDRARRAVGNIFTRRGKLFNKTIATSSSSSSVTTSSKPPLASPRPPSAASLSVAAENLPAAANSEADTVFQHGAVTPSTVAKVHTPLRRVAISTKTAVLAEEADSTSSTADGTGTATESEVSLLTNPSESDVRILEEDNDVRSSADEQNEIEFDSENDKSGPICISTVSSATVVMTTSINGRRRSSAASLTALPNDAEMPMERTTSTTHGADAVEAVSVFHNTSFGGNDNSSSAETLADPDEIFSRTFSRLREACDAGAAVRDVEDPDDVIKFADEPFEIDARLSKFIKSHVFVANADKSYADENEHCVAVCKCDLLCEPSLHADLLRGRAAAAGGDISERRQPSTMIKSDLLPKPLRSDNWMTSSVVRKASITSSLAESSISSSVATSNTISTVSINNAIVVFSTLRVYILRMVNFSMHEEKASLSAGSVKEKVQYLSAYNIANELEVLGSWPLTASQQDPKAAVAEVERSLKGQCLMLKLPMIADTKTRRWRKKRASVLPPALRCCLLMIADQKRCARLVNALTDFSIPVNENLGSLFSPSVPFTDKTHQSMWLESVILRSNVTIHEAENDLNANLLFMTLCRTLLPNTSVVWSCLAITVSHLVLIKRVSHLVAANLFAFSVGGADDAPSDGANEYKLSESLLNMPSSSLAVKAQYQIMGISFSELRPLTMKIVFDCEEQQQFSPRSTNNSSGKRTFGSPEPVNQPSQTTESFASGNDEGWLLEFATVDTMEAVVGIIRTNCERIFRADLPIKLVHI